MEEKVPKPKPFGYILVVINLEVLKIQYFSLDQTFPLIQPHSKISRLVNPSYLPDLEDNLSCLHI